LRELRIGLVPYSPLGRGFLTGAIRSAEQLGERDYRRSIPRFSGDNLERHLRLVEELRALAAEKGVTPAQLALAWLLTRGDDLVPISGMERVELLEQNAHAVRVALTEAEGARLERVFAAGAVAGARFSNEELSHPRCVTTFSPARACPGEPRGGDLREARRRRGQSASSLAGKRCVSRRLTPRSGG